MKTLYKALNMGIMSSALILGGCSRQACTNKPREQANVEEVKKGYFWMKGHVFSERYMPASGSSFNSPDIKSRYSFSVDTEYGRKGIQVYDSNFVNKETIDSLVESGTIVEIKVGNSDDNVYRVFAHDVKVLKKQT